jgi:hypothetical protein
LCFKNLYPTTVLKNCIIALSILLSCLFCKVQFLLYHRKFFPYFFLNVCRIFQHKFWNLHIFSEIVIYIRYTTPEVIHLLYYYYCLLYYCHYISIRYWRCTRQTIKP